MSIFPKYTLLHGLHIRWLAGCCAVAGSIGALLIWQKAHTDAPITSTEITSANISLIPVRIPDLSTPEESYATFLYVLQTGGCEITRPAAITWLDVLASKSLVMPKHQQITVLRMIETGGHESWTHGYRLHLWNSAFNALHICNIGESFTRQLLHIAKNHSDLTMRLYAMQHIGMQRRIGQLSNGPLAEEIYAIIKEIAGNSQSGTSGYAVDLLVNWHGQNAPIDKTISELALAIAADHQRALDVRVHALFAAGSSSLELARLLANDANQPMMVRKSSIACIGEYGSDQDLQNLSRLCAENGRLAQAAEPARAKLLHGQQKTPKDTLIPY